MSQHNAANKLKYDLHAKELPTLQKGDIVLCQNTVTKKWDRSATVIEICNNPQYLMKMDGSGRVSMRNRHHLQKFIQKTWTEIPMLKSKNDEQNNIDPTT